MIKIAQMVKCKIVVVMAGDVPETSLVQSTSYGDYNEIYKYHGNTLYKV